MQSAASLTTNVPALQQLVLEQQHMIETLTEQLRLAIHRQFGSRNEIVDVNQLGLFAKIDETSSVIELSNSDSELIDAVVAEKNKQLVERKQAVRILKDLPREFG